MRRAVVLTALLTVGLMAPPVGADEPGTPCTFEADVTLSPGLSRSPSTGSFTTNGESGALDCQGDVGGAPASGPGTFGADGRYGTGGNGVSCDSRQGQGDGTAHYTIPVDGGSRHVDDPFTLTYRVDGRSVVGEITGRRFSGTFDVTKANGDCYWHPITKIHIKGKGHLRPEDPSSGPVPLPS